MHVFEQFLSFTVKNIQVNVVPYVNNQATISYNNQAMGGFLYCNIVGMTS